MGSPVKTIEGKTFNNQVIRLGGNRFVNCSFISCKLVFGGQRTGLTNSTFDDCELEFDGYAANTLQFLTSLYPLEFGPYVEQVRERVRKGERMGPAPN